MPVYKKLTKTTDERFAGRGIGIFTPGEQTSIPVPDTTVVCDGCNENQYPEDGYLVYLSNRELALDRPYDFFCPKCVKEYFPGAILVG